MEHNYHEDGDPHKMGKSCKVCHLCNAALTTKCPGNFFEGMPHKIKLDYINKIVAGTLDYLGEGGWVKRI